MAAAELGAAGSATRVLGVTGGIASGKSTVSKILRDRCGAVLIDADKLGHESYEPGQPCYKKLVEEFGEGIVAPDGTINRKALGSIVFSDPDQRRRLEGIVWPAIQTMAEERIQQFKQAGTPCVALEAAVMLEANWRGLVDELWVVSTPEDMAVERMAMRNGLTREQALSRIHAQASNAEREAKADVVIHTVGTLEELEEKVLRHWRERGLPPLPATGTS